MSQGRRTKFLITVKADFSMSKHELRTKFKHWIEHNCHTCSSFGFEIEELAKPVIEGTAE